MERKRRLVIISCSDRKIWKKFPSAGPTPAKDAYTSPIFSVSREYAEKFGDRWLILSAKYGFIEPDFVIPANYNIRMGEPGSVSVSGLARQAKDKGLGDFAYSEGFRPGIPTEGGHDSERSRPRFRRESGRF